MEPADRPTIDVSPPVGGWPRPWPAVAELAAVLPPKTWTLVGGLMTQLHTINNGFGVVRPTDDVDIVLHIETTRGLPDATASALRSIGYDLRDPGTVTTISVPRPFGAVILKAAAYRTDSRDRGRHLAVAAALLACIEDPFAERDGLAGSDRIRLRTLQRELPDDHFAWFALPEDKRNDARAALRILNPL